MLLPLLEQWMVKKSETPPGCENAFRIRKNKAIMNSNALTIFLFLSWMTLSWETFGYTTWPSLILSSVFSAQETNQHIPPLKQQERPDPNAHHPDNGPIKAKDHTSQKTARTLNSFAKAQEYFAKRQRPLRHFLDIGIGATLIESFYPFEMTAYPFSVYANYRREKWGQLKLPLAFSLQYAPLFNRHIPARIHTLAGIRYPASHDLKLFHIDFHIGVSFPLDFSFKIHKPALELRFLLTHIIGPKDSRHRLYFQWGPKAYLTKKQFRSGLIVHLGLDNHL